MSRPSWLPWWCSTHLWTSPALSMLLWHSFIVVSEKWCLCEGHIISVSLFRWCAACPVMLMGLPDYMRYPLSNNPACTLLDTSQMLGDNFSSHHVCSSLSLLFSRTPALSWYLVLCLTEGNGTFKMIFHTKEQSQNKQTQSVTFPGISIKLSFTHLDNK